MKTKMEIETSRMRGSHEEDDLTILDEAGVIKHPSGHWLSVVSHLDPRYGGLSAVVPQLGSMIAEAGTLSVELAAFCAPNELYAPANRSTMEVSYWPASRLPWLRNPAMRDRFQAKMQQADGVHIHGLWEQSTAIAGHTARALRKPYVLSAHGMLEPWALSNRRLKKLVYSALFERANVRGATCLHALTGAEAQDYKRFGGRGPVAVIPNGVHIPQSLNPEPFFTQFPALKHKRIFLFLGRLHQKKGLDILIQSWSALARVWPEAHLVLAGPDFDGTRARVEQQILELGLVANITLPGMLRNELKWSALAAAECFILPSYSEGLSVSVLEAMGTGLPVIVSEQCNLPEVKELEAGLVIQSNTASLTYAIREFLSNSSQTNRQIGNKGRSFVAERYTWATVSAQMSELYSWLQGGPRPQNVDLLMA